MNLNYDKLYEFLAIDDYGYYDSRSIPLNELYENVNELTVDELMDLLAYIDDYTGKQIDYSETAIYNINIKYTSNNGGHEIALLEMKWPTDFDRR